MTIVEEVTDHWEPAIEELILGFLKIVSKDQLGVDWTHLFDDLSEDEQEELHDIPDDFEILIDMGYVESQTISHGQIVFGVYKGRRVVMERNASPFIVYFEELK